MNRSSRSAAQQQPTRLGRPSAQESREKMEEVLRVARHEFVKNGYRATKMDAIAAAADVSKRTLYLWHKDKAALFLACVLEGARRFPALSIGIDDDIERGLKAYAAALVTELASDFTFKMGLLVIREARDFPELAKASADTWRAYVVEPLARYLRHRGFERADFEEKTQLLIAMMLSEVHAALLNGGPAPKASAAERQARLAVEVFFGGSRANTTRK